MSTPIQTTVRPHRAQTALVTGGSRGLGLQIAQALGEAGAQDHADLAQGRRPRRGRGASAGRGIDARWIAADASQPDEIAARRRRDDAAPGPHRHPRQQRRRDLGRAGRRPSARGLGQGDEPEHPQHLPAVARRSASASMIPRKRGRIINIASIAGLCGNAPEMQTIAYNTSKGAVVNFTRTLAAEWGKYGINVNALAPGFFPSKMTKGLLETLGEDKHGRARAAAAHRRRRRPEGRGAAVRLATPASTSPGRSSPSTAACSVVQRLSAARWSSPSASRSSSTSASSSCASKAARPRSRSSCASEQCNSWSVAHGGVTMTLLDVVMAHAARSPNQPGMPERRRGHDRDEDQLHAARARARSSPRARLLHRSTTLAFCDGLLYDGDGPGRGARHRAPSNTCSGLPAGGAQDDSGSMHRIDRPTDRTGATMAQTNKQIVLASRPAGRGDGGQLPPRRVAGARARSSATARCWCATTT